MASPATKFANQFEAEFRRETGVASFKEIPLFRAMMRAFAALTPRFHLEEYHGSRRQVYFDTSFPWMRPRARCELCDVLFLVYTTVGGFSLRATLLQAKLSRASHVTADPLFAARIEPQTFLANYEQWDLLSARPRLIPTSVFFPPEDLLSAALLPSIGSFGVFHKLATGAVDVFYVCADRLTPSATPMGPGAKYGNLSTRHGGVAVRSIDGWREITYCANAHRFAKTLYQLEIGTPVLDSDPGGIVKGFEPYARWILGVLRSHLSAEKSTAQLARFLLERIGSAFDFPGSEASMNDVKQPTLLILRSEHPRPDSY